MREQWDVPETRRAIGIIGRLDPMKDHTTFFMAAARLVSVEPDVSFICVGDGPTTYKRKLQTLVRTLDLEGCVVWEGSRSDMPAVYSALDIVTSTSRYGEGFPNVIGEAMACGVLCVATDVGDSALILGDAGKLVPPHDPVAVCLAWKVMLSMGQDERAALGVRARERIINSYTVTQMTERTVNALEAIVAR